YRWLAARHFDVIPFNDCCGEGSAALAAKRTGLAFRDSLLVVGLHSPSRWVFELNHTLPSSTTAAAFDFSERVSTAAADVLWSPSRYLLDWIADHGFALPDHTFVQQYVMPSAPRPAARTGNGIREIVFFGRLEERKGLRTFCNAIDSLQDDLARHNVTITFLGKPETCAGMPSLDYIAKRAKSWRAPLKTLTSLGQPDALAYLRDGGRLAVMPSPADNSPCTIYEALAEQVPFLAARSGGIPELIAEGDRDHVLFEPSLEGLANALQRAMASGVRTANPAVPRDVNLESWRALHAHWKSFLPPQQPRSASMTFAAIIEHRAGDLLGRTLNSLCALPNYYRTVVLNRSGEALPDDPIDLQRMDHDAILARLMAITEDAI